MQRLNLSIIFIFLSLMAMAPGNSWAWGDKPLVEINGEKYHAEDFKVWWQNWQEQNQPVPETLDSFIDWQLLSKEAEKMELDRNPNYKQKISVFLKVRSLMLLKKEEIDSKIDLDEKIIRKEYDKEYAPLQRLQMYFFADLKQAATAQQLLQNGNSTPSELKQLSPGKGGPTHYQETLLRPNTPPPAEWNKALNNLKTNEISQPIPWHNNSVVLLRKDGEPQKGNEEDFATRKKKIGKILWKKQRNLLTSNLIKHLHQKYNFQVDDQLLAKIPVDGTPLAEELADKPVITTTERNISAGEFYERLKKERKFRTRYGFSKEKSTDIKQKLVNGIISQTLTSWEAKSRHYEKRPPFQQIYNFYCQHRLIKELEQRLFISKATANTKEITAYYQQHLEKFKLPETVTIASVSGDKATAKKMWTGVIMGEDFFTLADKYYDQEPKPQEMPSNHLGSELAQALQPLSPGEVSPPFQQKNNTVMVKLIKRKKASHRPLSEVTDKIAKDLRNKTISRLRDEYLDKIKDRSTISVDNKAWQALKKNLAETK